MDERSLTVVLPVYNGQRYLRDAIESILGQSYRDFELLIVDDGSSDSTPNILAHFADRDRRIRLLRHGNKGVGYSIQRGMREARGKLIAEIGADDIVLPDRFRKQVTFFENNPDYVLLGGQLSIIDGRGRRIGMRRYPKTDEQLRKALVEYNPFGGSSLMYRRQAALDSGGYTSRFQTCEDYDFLLRLSKLGKIANHPDTLSEYRLHGGATKSQKTLQQLKDTLAVKRVAYSEYGYRETPKARLVNLVEAAMLVLPPSFTYWLFTKLVLKPNA
jgi:glycosyltransferase involved in cell wall biosynthesis